MDKETRSYLIYFGLALICFIFGHFAEKHNNKKLVFVIALLLTLVMGLRKNTVGIDTNNYYWMFYGLKSINDARQYSDPLFYVYAYFLMKIVDDPYFVFLVFSAITNFLVIYRLWDYKDISSFKYSVLRYITIFFFFAFNCMRQFLSVAIVFYGTKYVKEGKYGKLLIYVALASTIHIASLVSSFYIIIDRIRKKELTIRQRNFTTIAVLMIPLYFLLTLFLANNRYDRYFANLQVNNLTSTIVKLVIFIIACFFFYSEGKFKKKDYNFSLSLLYYFLGIIFVWIGGFYQFTERIGYYFYIYATVYLGIVANEKRYRMLFRIIILFIVIRSFYLNCSSNSMGQIPYLFNWE